MPLFSDFGRRGKKSPLPDNTMISLLFTIIGSVVGIGALGAWLFSRQRRHLLDPKSLIITPASELRLERLDAHHFVLHGDTAMPVAVYSGVHPARMDYTRTISVDVNDEGEIILHDARPLPHRYFELMHDTGERQIVAERVLGLEGGVNFRDLGGYPTHDGKRVKWGMIYRSGTLANLTRRDWQYLGAMRVRTVCDFRSQDEVLEEPYRYPFGMHYLHHPIQTDESTLQRVRTMLFSPHKLGDIMRHIYEKIVIDDNPALFKLVFDRLTNPAALPLVIHCVAGKDRTGIVAAVLLAVLGVPDEIIIADYTLSNHYYHTFAAYAQATLDRVRWLKLSSDVIQPFLLADARIIAHTLDHIREKYGSVEGYLVNHAGVTPEALIRVREILLEP